MLQTAQLVPFATQAPNRVIAIVDHARILLRRTHESDFEKTHPPGLPRATAAPPAGVVRQELPPGARLPMHEARALRARPTDPPMLATPMKAACLALLVCAPALAQSTRHKPLNLELPPQDIPATASSAHGKASATPVNPAAQPGVYYGDTSGRPPRRHLSTCDDATYNQAQVHGSVGAGVAAGNHVSGSYRYGTANLSKAFGSCAHPTGSIHLSVGVGTSTMNGPRPHH